jgi:hypothetical protein
MRVIPKVSIPRIFFHTQSALLTLIAFDPEDDVPAEGSEGSDSEESERGLAGTEHYGEVRWVIHFRILEEPQSPFLTMCIAAANFDNRTWGLDMRALE